MASLRSSLGRLGLPSVGLYQIHGPISLRSHAALADALAAAHQAGLVGAVGVSNYSVKETRAMAEALGSRGMRLATNQIEFSLLRRAPETNGLLAACRDLGVLPLAYSPIGQGRLTGKYSVSNPPPGKRTFSNHPMEVVDRVVAELRRVGEKHGGKLPSQVALNWVMAKGAVPIPGRQEPSPGRGERRSARLDRRRGGPGPTRRRGPPRHPHDCRVASGSTSSTPGPPGRPGRADDHRPGRRRNHRPGMPRHTPRGRSAN